LKQANCVNEWDRVLQKGHTSVAQLRESIDGVQTDQTRLEAELDFIVGQQKELEALLLPLEEGVGGEGAQGGDRQRDNMYHLAQTLDGQLRQMSGDLGAAVEHVNAMNASAKKDDPLALVTKILGSHLDTLRWVDTNAQALQTKMETLAGKN